MRLLHFILITIWAIVCVVAGFMLFNIILAFTMKRNPNALASMLKDYPNSGSSVSIS